MLYICKIKLKIMKEREDILKTYKINNPKFYLFESKYPKRVNFTKGFKKLLKDLEIECKLHLSATRYAYDSSDNTAWVLLFGENNKELDRTRELLHNIEYDNQKVFIVSGNGWGTGLSVLLNYNKSYR